MLADMVLIVLRDVCAVNPRHMSPQTPCYLGRNENVSVFSNRSAERLLTHINSNFLSSRFFASCTEYETNPNPITKRSSQLMKVSARPTLVDTEVTVDV